MSWTFSHVEEYDWDNDDFYTKEEAIKAGIDYAKEYNYDYIYVGEISNINLELRTYAETVIEDIANHLDNELGDIDAGNYFINSISNENETRLQELLDDAFNEWLKECNITCPVHSIDNIERIEIKGRKLKLENY